MSAQAPATQTEWLQNLPIPWLVSGPVGSKWATATGTIIDTYVGYLKQGIQARMPDKAPLDALPHIGADRQLVQGSNESTASFAARLLDAWGQWGRAGTPCSVLEQLYYFGLSGAIWVQQNGLQYTLSGAPTPGQDPTSLVVASNCPTTGGTLSSSADPYRQIPAGTPWAFLDANTDLCNRFSIRIPFWPFAAQTQVTFNGTDSAVATWPFKFGGNVYSVIPGVPNVPVILTVDGNSLTRTQATILASGPWSGTVTVTAYAAGVSPLNTFSLASLGILQRLISTFRPNAICTSVYAINNGRVLGDGRHLGDGGVLGGSVTQILGSF